MLAQYFMRRLLSYEYKYALCTFFALHFFSSLMQTSLRTYIGDTRHFLLLWCDVRGSPSQTLAGHRCRHYQATYCRRGIYTRDTGDHRVQTRS